MTWQEVHVLAVAIGAADAASDGQAPFDPPAYAAVYGHLLRHRRALTLWVDAQLDPRESVHDLDVATKELVPTAEEASGSVAQLERECAVGAIEHEVATWFDRV